MKKTVISVLVVLLLSVMVLGCPTGPCEVCGEEPCICESENASKLDKIPAAKAALVALVGQEYADSFPVPLGTTLSNYEAGGKFIAFYWTGANQAMFDHYQSVWLARAAAAVIGDHTDGKFKAAAKIVFDGVGGDAAGGGFKFPANTIIFSGEAN